MKALSKLYSKEGIWMVEDAPMVKIESANQVKIKIKKTAICGTDIHIYKWDAWAKKTIPVPMIIGHEFFGIVEEVGSLVTRFKKGDRVSGEGHVTCGKCYQCLIGKRHLCPDTLGVGVNRQGCFAEYLVIPDKNLVAIPENISDELASYFDPFGNAVHTTLSFPIATRDILITGAGPIGIMSAAICRYMGARKVVLTDISDYRLRLAEKVADVITVNTSKESLDEVRKKHGIENGFHVGLEMAGVSDSFRDLVEHLTCGGEIALLGILPNDVRVDWGKVIFKGLFIKGIYGREIFNTWFQMVGLIQGGLDISSVVTHRYTVNDYEKAFKQMLSGNSGKIILDWE